MTPPRTMFAKIWESHVVQARADGTALLYVDRHMVHEGSHHAFRDLLARGLSVRRPRQNFATADHYVPTRSRRAADAATPEIAAMIETFDRNMAATGVTAFPLGDPRQGIVHVIGPELGITLPGLVIACGDSHTSTHGALGAFAFGIGQSEMTHVLATETLWQRRPKAMRIMVSGRLSAGLSAKDVILAIIARIGAGGAVEHVIEYAGQTVRAMDVEARLTVCNMSIEAGGRAGMIAPDDQVYSYLAGRDFAPKGAAFDQAVAAWRQLLSDEGAVFDREVAIDVAGLAPMVSWGTSPEDSLPITAAVPDPDTFTGEKRASARRALDYMGLVPGTALEGLAIDQVFIGSCTNARISDLRAAAAVLKGRKARVPVLVSPGSTAVKRQAEAEGLDQVFRAAGCDWRESGCSMCVGMNGDLVGAGKRCVSTANRNFPGRQGKGARTHLASPAMAAAAAVNGHLADVRRLLGG